MVRYSGRVTLSNLLWYLLLAKRKNWKTFAIRSVICEETADVSSSFFGQLNLELCLRV